MTKSKILFTILAVFFLMSCDKEDTACSIPNALYNIPIHFQLDDRFCFSDGLEIHVEEVEDRRCPCFVACIWEGEFVYKLELSKDGATETYTLHQLIENDTIQLADISIEEIELITENECPDEIEIEDKRFSFIVSNE